MKTRSILFSMLFAATASALFSNCSGSKKGDTTESHEHNDSAMKASDSSTTAEASEPQFAVDAAFQEQLAGVFTAYVSLKDAFISSDANKVKAEVSATKQSFSKADMKLLSGAAHNDWMNYLNGLETSLKEIQATDDIEAQRKAFTISFHD
jgi:hypothetical protein